MTVINSTMGSALPSMAIPFIAREWGVTSDPQLSLPISTYLIGYVFGPLLCKLEMTYTGKEEKLGDYCSSFKFSPS
jgi:hypothetical protein